MSPVHNEDPSGGAGVLLVGAWLGAGLGHQALGPLPPAVFVPKRRRHFSPPP